MKSKIPSQFPVSLSILIAGLALFATKRADSRDLFTTSSRDLTTSRETTVEKTRSPLLDVRSKLVNASHPIRVSRSEFVMVYVLDRSTLEYLDLLGTPTREMDELFHTSPDGTMATWMRDDRDRYSSRYWNYIVKKAAGARFEKEPDILERLTFPRSNDDLIDASEIDLHELLYSDFIGLDEMGHGVVRLPDGTIAMIGPGGLPGAENYGSTGEGDPNPLFESGSSEQPEDIIAAFFDEAANSYRNTNAYLLSLLMSYVYFDDLEEQVGPGSIWGFESVEVVADNQEGSYAAVLRHEDVIIVTFRGTEGILNEAGNKDALADLDALMVSMPQYGYDGNAVSMVHKGFNESMMTLYHGIVGAIGNDTRPVFVTGHSLGGAMAQLFSYWYHIDRAPISGVYTFGTPRVGNLAFAHCYEEEGLKSRSFEITNPHDPVTMFPPAILGYSHVGTVVNVGWYGANPLHHHDNWLYAQFMWDELTASQQENLPTPQD